MRVARNHTNHRIGQSHPKAKLSDEKVREMRRLNQQEGIGYLRLGRMFGCGESTARDICTYRTRASA